MRLFDETVAAVALFAGAEHRLVYQNEACARLLGARPVGLPAREAFPEPDAGEFLTVLDEVVASGRPRQLPEAREPDPGAPEQARYFVYSCTPVTMAEGRGAMVVALDTTAETMALERYEAVVTAVSQMVWVLRADGSAQELVPGWQQLTGSPWRDRMDEQWGAHIHPHDRARLRHEWHAALAKEFPGLFETTFRVRASDGSYRHMSTRCVPILRNGHAEEWIAATDDVQDTWSATLRERLLAEIAQVSGEGLDESFAAVAKAIVPELADACVIMLLDHEEWPPPEHVPVTARRAASATRHGLPTRPPLQDQTVVISGTVRDVLARRAPCTFNLSAGKGVPPGIVPAVTEQWLRSADATSLTLYPLVAEDVDLGYAATSANGDSPAPGPADTTLIQGIFRASERPSARPSTCSGPAAPLCASSMLISPARRPFPVRAWPPATSRPAPRTRSAATGTTPSSTPRTPSYSTSETSPDTTSQQPPPWDSCAACSGALPGTTAQNACPRPS